MSKISFKARDLKLSKGAGFKGYIDFKSKNLLFSDKNLAYDIINQNIKDKDDKYIVIGDKTLFEDVIEVKRSVAGSLYQSNMTMLEITLKGYYDILDEWVEYKREIASNLINDGESEWIDYGLFKVTQCDYNDEDETTQIVAFDKMIETQKEYKQEDMQITFPATVGTVFNRVLQVCGLETTTTTFPNSDELITEDVWANASYTYRDVLSHIAQVSGSIIGVKDDKIEVYQPTDTGFTINQSKLSKLQMGETYGKINILNLTREPQHDNYAYPTDFNTIPQNERKELVFENNPIVDKERERWAPLIFPLINDLEYREFTADAFVGYGIFDVGDIVTVQEYNTNESYTCMITDEYTTHTQGMSGEVKSNKPFASKEQYVVVTDERREGQKTYILVDQLNGQIILATEKIDELEDKATELGLDIDGLMASVESIHNGNVIPNLNGELGYYGWQGAGSELVFTDDLVFAEGMKFENAFVPKQMEGSLSDWGISLYGKNRSPLGRIIPNTHYSWRGKAIKFLPFDITVIEYAEDKTVLQNTVYNFTNPSTYLQFTHEPNNDTRYIALEFNSPAATYTNRLELSEMMFNRGEPKAWFANADSVKTWAESRFEIQDDMIKSTVSDVQIIDGKVTQNESSITQLSDEISLKADKIELEGKVGFSDLTTEGRTEINGGNITTGEISANRINFDGAKGSNVDLSGKITASSGKIGGYTISGNNLVGNNVTLGQNEISIGGSHLRNSNFQNGMVEVDGNGFDILGRDGFATIIRLRGNILVNNFGSSTSHWLQNIRAISASSDAVDIGNSDRRFNSIYLKNQPNVSSDIRQKHSIQDIPKDLIDEIIKVEPKMYLQHKTWHFGYIAQDIERALYKWATREFGKDAKYYVDKFAFLHKDESYLSLLYGEIAVLKEKAMSERIDKLENELQEIKELLKERND